MEGGWAEMGNHNRIKYKRGDGDDGQSAIHQYENGYLIYNT